MRELWRILYEYDADLVLSAHAHNYERFAPQDFAGTSDPLRGIRQFVVGTGGAPLSAFAGMSENSEVQVTAHGVLKLTLGPESYAWEFVPVDGAADYGVGACH